MTTLIEPQVEIEVGEVCSCGAPAPINGDGTCGNPKCAEQAAKEYGDELSEYERLGEK
jgi:hypothetical protein